MKTFRHLFLQLIVLSGLLSLLSACSGGGGGGNNGSAGITYSGATTPVALSSSNANIIFSAIWNGGSSSGSTGSLTLAPARAESAPFLHAQMSRVRTLVSRVGGRLPGESKQMKTAVPVNDTYSGKVSGTRTITGSLDDTTLTGTLTMTYANFNDGDGDTYDGSVTIQVDGYDFASDTLTDWTMTCTSWTVKSTGSSVTLSGSLRSQENVQAGSETLTINMDGRDNIANETFRFSNYVQKSTYDSLLAPTTESETYSGRLYLEKYGYVDISTVSPCVYSDPKGDPNSGGPIVLAGAGNTRAKVTPLSGSYVKIEVDSNGDGVIEDTNAYAWSNLGGAPSASTCFADAGPDQTVSTGSMVTLDGSGSTDLNGSALTYAWTMTAKPIGSSAVLSSPTQTGTTFIADVAGSYTITLTVGNGMTTSDPDTVVVTASGSALTSIVATPANTVIQKGATQQFKAVGTFSDGSTRDLTNSATWTSSDAGKISINTSGLALGANVGSAVITASMGNLSSTAPVRVVAGFMAAIQYAAPPSSSLLGNTAVGDLNGDGRNDVAVIDGYVSRVTIYYQNAGGTLSLPQVISVDLIVHGVAVADVNNDGLADLIISGNSTTALSGPLGRIAVFRQDGATHTLGVPQYYPLSIDNVGPLAIADLNDDGLPDVAAAGQGTPNGVVSILFQGAGGALLPEVTYTNVFVVVDGELHVADMNNDGLNDIVLQSGDKQLAVIRQVSPGTFSNTPDFYSVQTSYWPYFRSFALGDVNGDGRMDIVVADLTGYLNIFLQNESGVLTGPNVQTFYEQDEVHIADIDGDGLNDIIISLGSSVEILYQSSDHSFLSPLGYSLRTQSSGGTPIHQALSVGDVTGDGLPDIVASWSNEGIFVLPRLP